MLLSTTTLSLDWSTHSTEMETLSPSQQTVDQQKELPAESIDADRLFKKVTHENSYRDFETLYKHYYDYLCYYAWKFVNEKELAEEVVSEVFFKLWKNKKKINVNTSFRSYLFIAVRNQAFDYLRKVRRVNYIDDTEAIKSKIADRHSPLEEAIFNEIYFNLEKAIENLPQQCRMIFRMSRDEGLRYREIANQLNISIKTVETQMGRALKKLRKVVS
ncbi:MAG: RNA polymerase sigma-70 factor [Cytophagales bacterium]|nr:RNA polymerase sigma-70 factor [Cytophagales bacterium]